MLVKTRFQGQLPGLVSLRDSVRHFDLAGLQIVTCYRNGVDGLERISTTRVTFSNPGASMSKDDVVGEVLVHSNTDKGHVGSCGEGDCSREVGGRVRAGTVRRSLSPDNENRKKQCFEVATQRC